MRRWRWTVLNISTKFWNGTSRASDQRVVQIASYYCIVIVDIQGKRLKFIRSVLCRWAHKECMGKKVSSFALHPSRRYIISRSPFHLNQNEYFGCPSHTLWYYFGNRRHHQLGWFASGWSYSRTLKRLFNFIIIIVVATSISKVSDFRFATVAVAASPLYHQHHPQCRQHHVNQREYLLLVLTFTSTFVLWNRLAALGDKCGASGGTFFFLMSLSCSNHELSADSTSKIYF